MMTIFTEDCPNGFEEVTLDNKDDLEKRIEELIARISKLEQEKDEKIIEEQLKKFERDGLVSRNEKGEYYPTDY